MKEIDRYRIDPPNSINRHSCRLYEFSGRRIVLDRTCDASPRFFSSFQEIVGFKSGGQPIFPPRILVGGKEYWGDGFSWKRAETTIAEVLQTEGGLI